MKKNNFVFPILITLLIIFLPATIYGVNKHNSFILDRDNPKHLPKKNNKLYFYDETDTLLGVYQCEDKKNCDVATSTIDDSVNLYYQGGEVPLPVYNKDFVFIRDGNKVLYYSLANKMELLTLNSVKDYGVGISGGLVIYQNEFSNYGLLDPTTGVSLIEPTYTYMGLIGDYFDENGKLSIDKIIVKKDNSYYLINETEDILSALFTDPIYSFDENVIYIRNDLGNYSIMNYQGDKVIPENFQVINFLENCNVLITTDYMVRVYSKDYSITYLDEHYDTANLSYEVNGDVLTIVNNDDETRRRVPLTYESSDNGDELF